MVLTEAGLAGRHRVAGEAGDDPGHGRRRHPSGPPPPAVETTAYFLVSEALANVAKHAGCPSGAQVRAVRSPADVLRIEIVDDGRRRAPTREPGTGLRGLPDRVVAAAVACVVEPARRRTTICRGAPMRIVIAEDLALLREGLPALLTDAGYEVVGPLRAPALLRDRRWTQPDVAIVDIRMPPTFPTRGCASRGPFAGARRERPGVIVLSQYLEPLRCAYPVARGRPAEGMGYLLKDRVADVEALTEAIHPGRPRRVRRGSGRRRRPRPGHGQRSPAPLDDLTDREREVLALMAEGRSNAGDRRAPVGDPEDRRDARCQHLLAKLGLEPTHDDHRRVLAVIAYLRAG